MEESINICNDLNNEDQYLCSAKLPKSNKVSQKSLSLSGINTSSFKGYKFKPRAKSKRSSKRQLENFLKKGHTSYSFEYSLLPKIDELRESVKISNATVTGIIKTKVIQKLPLTDTVPFYIIETERVEVQSVTSLIRFAIILKIVFQMKYKISLSNF